MEILVKRHTFTKKSTIGDLFINGVFFCNTLEDFDRGLKNEQGLEYISKHKVKDKTCIPTGKYEMIISFSDHFKKLLPLLLLVLGFAGIRAHSGNDSGDTEGCLILGTYDSKTPDWVSNSHITFDKFFAKLQDAIKKEKVWITIQ